MDIGEQNVPADDMPVRTAQREPTNLKPSIDAIEPSDARLEVVGLTGGDRVGKDLNDTREIPGVDGPVRTPLLHRLQRLTAIHDELVVDEVDLARWCQRRHHAWDRIDDQA